MEVHRQVAILLVVMQAGSRSRYLESYRGVSAAVPSGQQGNFGRNVLRGFDALEADIALQRQFRFQWKR